MSLLFDDTRNEFPFPMRWRIHFHGLFSVSFLFRSSEDPVQSFICLDYQAFSSFQIQINNATQMRTLHPFHLTHTPHYHLERKMFEFEFTQDRS